MELSKRLMSVANGVTAGNRLADIGTDHGYIPIFLVESGKVPSAIAMDVNEGPLLRAKQHIEEAGLAGCIKTRISNGLEALSKDEADSIVIAGMGGALMEDILIKGKEILLEGKELILQPQSEIFKVRRCLHQMEYEIIREELVLEDGKFYFILKAVPGRQKFLEEYLYDYGEYLLKKADPLMIEYLKKEEKKYKQILKKLITQNSPQAKKRMGEVKKQMDKIKKAYEYEV